MPRIQIGVQLAPQLSTFAAYRQAWLEADEIGVDSIWNWDHFFPLSRQEPDGAHFEGWTSLAVLAAQTKRARVGCLVLSMSYRNPGLLAQMANVLDHAIDGRLVLGLGAGWVERDYDRLGYEFGPPAERLRALERGIETIRGRWEQDEPKPPRGTIPILIGGDGEKVMLRIIARHADMWNAHGPPERWAHKNRVLDEWCERIGRDPASIERTADVRGADEYGRIEEFVEAGATHVILAVPPPYDLRPVEKLLALRDSWV